MGALTFPNDVAANVSTPVAGKTALFFDTNADSSGLLTLKYRDANGVVWVVGNRNTGTTTFDNEQTAPSPVPAAEFLWNGLQGTAIFPSLAAGDYNGIVANNDTGIIFGSNTGTKSLVLAPWSTTNVGIRIDANAALTTIYGNAAFTNTVSIASNLSVGGSSTFSNTVSIAGVLSVNNALTVNGVGTFANNVSIAGVLTVNNSANVVSNLNVGGNLAVNGNFTVAGNTIFSGTQVVNGAIKATGTSVFDNGQANVSPIASASFAHNGSVGINILPWAGAGDDSPIPQAQDAALVFYGSGVNNSALSIVPYSTAHYGMRLDGLNNVTTFYGNTALSNSIFAFDLTSSISLQNGGTLASYPGGAFISSGGGGGTVFIGRNDATNNLLALIANGTSYWVANTTTITQSQNIVINSANNAALYVNKVASGHGSYVYGQTNGVSRWNIVLGDGSAESGNNSGSNFAIQNYSDSGAYMGNSLSIIRSSGQVWMNNLLTAQMSVGTGSYPPYWYESDANNGVMSLRTGTSAGYKYFSWDQNGNFNALNGGITATGEIVSSASFFDGQFRSVYGNYGVFWRYDGASLYLMKTASGNQYGTWDGTRPFVWNLAGGISSDQPWTMTDGITVSGGATTISCGVTTQQMITLYGSAGTSGNYGIGVQSSSAYFRSGVGNFYWYAGGVHNNAQGNSGGGTQLMSLGSTGDLTINVTNRVLAGAFQSSATSLNPQSTPGGGAFRAQGNFGGGISFIDGAYSLAMYSVAGNMTFGFGNSTVVTSTGGSINADGSVHGTRFASGYDSGITYSFNTSDWFRSSGQVGWYNASYGGGIYMIDGTYVRTYNGKSMAAADFVISSDLTLKHVDGPMVYDPSMRLQPIWFHWLESGAADFGFGAQTLEQNHPLAVHEYPDANDTSKMIKNVSYSKLTAILASQTNYLEDELCALKQEVKILKEKFNPGSID